MTRLIKLLALVILTYTPGVLGLDLIVNSENNAMNMSEDQIKAIFTLRLTHWKSGEAIIVVTLPDSHDTHKSFVKNQLGMFPYQLRRLWDKQTFAGMARAPIVVNSIDDMIQEIKKNPHAIGYIDRESNDEAIKTINIQ